MKDLRKPVCKILTSAAGYPLVGSLGVAGTAGVLLPAVGVVGLAVHEPSRRAAVGGLRGFGRHARDFGGAIAGGSIRAWNGIVGRPAQHTTQPSQEAEDASRQACTMHYADPADSFALCKFIICFFLTCYESATSDCLGVYNSRAVKELKALCPRHAWAVELVTHSCICPRRKGSFMGLSSQLLQPEMTRKARVGVALKRGSYW